MTVTKLIPIDFDKLKVGDEVIYMNGTPATIVFIDLKTQGTLKILTVIEKEGEGEGEGEGYYSNWVREKDIFQKPGPMKKLWIAVAKNPDEYGNYHSSYAITKNLFTPNSKQHILEIEVPA